MDMQNMVTLPVKYLKPIYMNVNSTDVTTTTTTSQTTNYAADFSASQFQTSTDYQTSANYQTSTDYTPATDYTPTTDFAATTTTTTTDIAGSFPFPESQTTLNAAQSTFQTTSTSITGAQQGLKILRRGSGITLNEQNSITEVAVGIVQQGINPVSNNTARGVKKKLGGDWLVIIYPQGKPIDFNMTCVQGNDYLYFVYNDMAFQVCRLK
jgi:hypothetical protein